MGTIPVLNIKDSPYNAAGNGSTDDSTAINDAIQDLPTYGGIVYLPSGQYRCNSPIQIIDNAGNGNRFGVHLMGANSGASGAANNTVIEWGGSSTTTPFLQIYSRDNIVSGMVIRAVSGKTLPALVDIDQESGHDNACTNNSLRDVRITGGGATVTDCVRIAATSVGNCEYNTFYDTYIADATNACVNLVDQFGQSKFNRFVRSCFNTAAYGIYQSKGCFTCDMCAFGALTSAAIRLSSVTDMISIRDTDAESCARFLYTPGGSSSYWPVIIDGGRFALNALHEDGEFIKFPFGGPLTIRGCLFDNGATYSSTFKIHAHAADPGTVLISEGNAFPTTTPYYRDPSHRLRLISIGNMGLTDGHAMAHVPDEIMQYVVSSNTVGFFVNPQKRATITYGASMTPVLTDGNEQDITATNTAAFTINAPSQVTTPDGQWLAVTIRNSSGGTLGNVTWNAVFKTSWNNAADKPANGSSRTVIFRWNGTNWVEISKTPSDVPN
jgi:hypothetical protein